MPNDLNIERQPAEVAVPPPKKKTAGFLQSKTFSRIIIGIIIAAVALLIFQLGMYVGFRKANFSFAWGDNYQNTFGGPRSGMMRNFVGNDFVNGHGTAGTIADIDGASLIIKDADGTEKMINVTNRTSIVSGHAKLLPADLRLDDAVTVIGQPGDDGTVSAEIIRVFARGNTPKNIPLPPQINY